MYTSPIKREKTNVGSIDVQIFVEEHNFHPRLLEARRDPFHTAGQTGDFFCLLPVTVDPLIPKLTMSLNVIILQSVMISCLAWDTAELAAT